MLIKMPIEAKNNSETEYESSLITQKAQNDFGFVQELFLKIIQKVGNLIFGYFPQNLFDSHFYTIQNSIIFEKST